MAFKRILCLFVAFAFFCSLSSTIWSQQGTAFTYQGQLLDDGQPANGIYDIKFSLFSIKVGGSSIGGLLLQDVAVADGLFSVELDFGTDVFDGSDRWLEITVNGTTLSPRQPVTGAPYSLSTRGIQVTEEGHVGIGQASSASKLRVDGDEDELAIYVETELGSGIRAISGDANGYAILGENSYGGHAGLFYGPVSIDGNTQVFGNLGINELNPGSPLHIVGGFDDDLAAYLENENGSGLRAISGDANGYAILGENSYGGHAGLFYGPVSIDGNTQVFGNLGINELNPGSPLHIVGGFDDDLAAYLENENGSGLRAISGDANGYAILGENSYGGHAGIFYGPVYLGGDLAVIGDLDVSGTLSKNGGSFKIDHPLDPENKYLMHSFVESPDMMNIYNGNAITDESGYATIEMPEWFEALNREFRYQLTVVDEDDDDEFVLTKVVEKIHDNSFRIRSSVPQVEISWQVTGVRKDAWAEANRIPTEVDKSGDEVGRYLTPEVFGHGPDKAIRNSRKEFVNTAKEGEQDD